MSEPVTIEVSYPPLDGTQPCQQDPELFFPTTNRQKEYARPRIAELCSCCPFRRPCLAYAVTHDVTGYWAGTSASERARLRRQHGITAIPIAGIPDEVHDAIHTATDRGESAAEIAVRLGVTPRTVVRHRTRTAS